MKKLLVLLWVFLCILFYPKSSYAQNNYNLVSGKFGKVKYFDGSYKDMLNAASQQNKPIMILFCRTGCHSCTHLRRSFAKTEMGEFVNRFYFPYFVDVDAEKFKLFPLSEKFRLRATPFLVVMTPDGKIIDKRGISPLEDSFLDFASRNLHTYFKYQKFLEETQYGMNKEKQILLATKYASIYTRISKGVHYNDFLRNKTFTFKDERFATFNTHFLNIVTNGMGNLPTVFNVQEVNDDTTEQKEKAAACKQSKWKKFWAKYWVNNN